MGILLFVLTSLSDPGTVNSENVSNYLSVYPYDKVIYVAKECRTCKIPKFVLFHYTLLPVASAFTLSYLIEVAFNADLPGLSTAAFVIDALPDLTITVDGW